MKLLLSVAFILMPTLSYATSGLRGVEHEASVDRAARMRALSTMDPHAFENALQQVVEVERIVGGTPPGPSDYPFFALIGDKNKNDYCGATLIAPTILLTAAHCEPSTSDFVKVGAYDKQDHDDNSGWIPIEQTIRHPAYNSVTLDNDFQIIVIPAEYAIVDGPFAGLAGASTDVSSGTSVTPIGFGTTEYGGSGSDVLLE